MQCFIYPHHTENTTAGFSSSFALHVPTPTHALSTCFPLDKKFSTPKKKSQKSGRMKLRNSRSLQTAGT